MRIKYTKIMQEGYQVYLLAPADPWLRNPVRCSILSPSRHPRCLQKEPWRGSTQRRDGALEVYVSRLSTHLIIMIYLPKTWTIITIPKALSTQLVGTWTLRGKGVTLSPKTRRVWVAGLKSLESVVASV